MRSAVLDARPGTVLIAVLIAMALAGCAATQASPPVASAKTPPAAAPPALRPVATAVDTALMMALYEIASTARQADDRGEPEAALVSWRKLRARTAPDADLELAIALDEARTGQLDSAAVRLAGPVLSAAAAESLPPSRYCTARMRRTEWTFDGTFEGWHRYVWRARSEVAARRGRWEEATVAARRCVAAWPENGQEWLLLAVCAGRAGLADDARAAARQAATRAAAVPEALYLNALWAWKDGRRSEAQAGFRAAVAQDSTYRTAVVALLRSRMAGSAPDTLPASVLTGPRAVGMLTTPVFPKLEDDVPVEQVPILASRAHPSVRDSLRTMIGERQLKLWLYVDEEGRVPLALPDWNPPGTFPTPVVSDLLALIPGTWRFLPANVKGVPRATWIDFNYVFPR